MAELLNYHALAKSIYINETLTQTREPQDHEVHKMAQDILGNNLIRFEIPPSYENIHSTLCKQLGYEPSTTSYHLVASRF